MSKFPDTVRRRIITSIKMQIELDREMGVDGYLNGKMLIPASDELIPRPGRKREPDKPRFPKRPSRIREFHKPDLLEYMSKINGNTFTNEPYPIEKRELLLKELAFRIRRCKKCDINPQRLNAVPGQGPADAEIFFVGEAPGADEDREGIPFIGRSGRLLTDIIEKGMKISRSRVYIANVLKCRPPGNRTPSPKEASICGPYLEEQIEIVRPKVICVLGAIATRFLLPVSPGKSMRILRGEEHYYRGIPVIVTYHPSYLLRNPAAKKDVWQDIKKLMKIVGITQE